MRLKKKSDERYWGLLEEIAEHGEDLTEWESDLVDDLMRKRDEYRARGYSLSKPQRVKRLPTTWLKDIRKGGAPRFFKSLERIRQGMGGRQWGYRGIRRRTSTWDVSS